MSDLPRPGPTTRRTVTEVVDDAARTRPDRVVTEEPLEIRLGWPGHEPIRTAVTMRTPGADFELAAGFLLSEGVVDGDHHAPATIGYCIDPTLTAEQRYNVVTVDLTGPPLRHPASRSTTVSSACGVCGTESLDEVFASDDAPIPFDGVVDPSVLRPLPERLLEVQPLFARTGAVHAAGIFSYAGELVVSREDIGRHNAVDKVLGARLLGTADFDEASILCVSGRIGFDIIAKAVAGRVSVVAAVGGPSSLALELAERAGITVCGFTRGRRYVVYTHPRRIRLVRGVVAP